MLNRYCGKQIFTGCSAQSVIWQAALRMFHPSSENRTIQMYFCSGVSSRIILTCQLNRILHLPKNSALHQYYSVENFRTEARLFYWDDQLDKWQIAPSLVPGMTLLVQKADGGYSDEEGWTGRKADKPEVTLNGDQPPRSDKSDMASETRGWCEVTKHLIGLAPIFDTRG